MDSTNLDLENENMDGYFEVYPEERRSWLGRKLLRRQWRWRFVSKNGRAIYGSTEGYNNKSECIATIPVLAGQHGSRVWREYA